MSEGVDVRFKQPLSRCPYCHDDCGLDAALVVCRACLARHHADCWAQLGKCGACGEERGLSEPARTGPVDPEERLAQIQEAVTAAATELTGIAKALARLFGPTVARWTVGLGLGGGALLFAVAPIALAVLFLLNAADPARAFKATTIAAYLLLSAGFYLPAWALFRSCRDHFERTAPPPAGPGAGAAPSKEAAPAGGLVKDPPPPLPAAGGDGG